MLLLVFSYGYHCYYFAILVQVPATMKNLLVAASQQLHKLTLFYFYLGGSDVISIQLGYVGAFELWMMSADADNLKSMPTPCWIHFKCYIPTYSFTVKTTNEGLTVTSLWRRAQLINLMVNDIATSIFMDG